MKTGIIAAAALCVAAGTAVADATWVPSSFAGGSSITAYAYDGNLASNPTLPINAFGIYTVSAFDGDSSATTTLDWDANGAHSDFSASPGSGIGFEIYYGQTVLSFTAVTGGDFEMNLQFDWQGSGASFVWTYFQIYDNTGVSDSAEDKIYTSGSVATTYKGTLVAGREYYMLMRAYVAGTNLIGDGSGSADVTLTSIPLPSASALAGLGLLGLGVRRRRGSL